MKYIPFTILIAFIVMLLSNLLLKGLLAKIISIIIGLYVFTIFTFFVISAVSIAMGFLGIALYNIFKSTKVNALT